MNVLHVIPYYAPAWVYGGSVRAVTGLTRAQVERGYKVFVLTTDTLSPTARIPTRHEIMDGVEVYRVPNVSNRVRGRLNLSTPRGIARLAERLIRDHAIDVVHCHELRTVENLRVAPVANALNVPVVVSPHGTLPYDTGRRSIKKGWDWLVSKRLLPRFDGVIALTRAEAEQARALWAAWGLAVATSVVANGVHGDAFAQLPSGEPFRKQWKLGEGPVVLFLGRLHERKGVQLLIPAFAEALKQSPDARLLIVGPDEGMLSALQAQVRDHQLAGHVVFTGMLTGEDRLAALAAADLFALPAVGEGFSMAVLEAMACGLPVLLTPGCHFPEVAEAGAGIVVERTIAALRGALRDLLADRERLATMGRAARALVETRYTWPQIAAQLDAVYADVLAKKRRN